jgi:hypothetical protein
MYLSKSNFIFLCSAPTNGQERAMKKHMLKYISEYAYGATGFTEWLLAYHGKPIRPPQSPQYLPKEEYLHWHMQQVFRGPARHLVGEDSSSRRSD